MPAPPLVAPPPALVQVTLEPPLLGSAMIWLPSALMSWPFLRSSFHWLLVLHTLGPTMREDGKGWGVRQVGGVGIAAAVGMVGRRILRHRQAGCEKQRRQKDFAGHAHPLSPEDFTLPRI